MPMKLVWPNRVHVGGGARAVISAATRPLSLSTSAAISEASAAFASAAAGWYEGASDRWKNGRPHHLQGRLRTRERREAAHRGPSTPTASLAEVVPHQHQPVVAPERPAVDDEGGHAEGPGRARFLGRLGDPPVRPWRGELSRERHPGQADGFRPPQAFILAYLGQSFHEDGGEKALAVRSHGAQSVRGGAGTGEQPRVEVHGAPGFLVGDAVVLGPTLCVLTAVIPVVLARDRFSFERADPAQPVEVQAVERAPHDLAARLALELSQLGRGQVGVPAADGVVEPDLLPRTHALYIPFHSLTFLIFRRAMCSSQASTLPASFGTCAHNTSRRCTETFTLRTGIRPYHPRHAVAGRNKVDASSGTPSSGGGSRRATRSGRRPTSRCSRWRR